MEHTPIPWRAKTQDIGGAQIWAERVGVAFTFAGDDQPSEANAAFIVRAVNNHAKLLEALERRGCEVDPTDPCFGDVLSPPVQGPHMKACSTCAVIEEAKK